MSKTTKQYIGDGAYVNTDDGNLTITAEDGVHVLAQVVIDRGDMHSFLRYIAKWFPESLSQIMKEKA